MSDGEDSKESRASQILHIDTHALLITLRELESKLSDHQRHDKIPAWAGSIIPRIDGLEAKLAKMAKDAKSKKEQPVSGAPEPTGLKEASDDSSVVALNKELTSRLDLMKVTFESQVSSLNLEVDRLLKLLQIRPTTSELQKVVLAVNEVKGTIQEDIKDISNSMSLLVKDKVAEEMLSIMDRLKTSEGNSEKGIGLILRKVETFGQTIDQVKASTESSIQIVNKSQEVIRERFSSFESQFSQIDGKLERVVENLQGEITGVREVQQLAAENFDEFRGDTVGSLGDLESKSETIQAMVVDLEALLEKKADDLSQSIDVTRDSIADFKALYEYEIGVAKTDLRNLEETAREHRVQLNEHDDFITKLKNINVIEKVLEHGEAIEKIQKQLADFEERLTTQNNKIKKMDKLTLKVAEEMEAFPKHVQEQSEKMAQVLGFLDNAKNEMSEMKTAFVTTSEQVTELYTMRDDVQLVRDLGVAQEQRVKSVQTTLDSILESADEHDKAIDDLVEKLNKLEATFDDKIIESRDGVLLNFQFKTAEIEAEIQNLRDNLNIIQEHVGEPSLESNSDGKTASIGRPNPRSITSTNPSEQERQIKSGTGPARKNALDAQSQSQIEILGDMCINFEGVSLRKTKVEDIPDTICEQMALIAQAVSETIATETDKEALQVVIRGSSNEDVSPESLSEKSQRKVDEFVASVKCQIEKGGGQPGIIRMEAREKFIFQLHKAMQTGMSKHDQVLVVGNSRFGRLKIPSCIACDRPLLNKVRQADSSNAIIIPRSDMGNVKPMNLMRAPIDQHDELLLQESSTGSMKSITGSKLEKSVRMPSLSITKSQKMSTSQPNLMMRSGLKVPKSSNAAPMDEETSLGSSSLPELNP